MFNYKKDLVPAVLLGIAWSIVIFVFVVSKTPLAKVISPLANPFKSITSFQPFAMWKNKVQTFAFLPGWTFHHLDNVDVKGLNTLAYFDLPVDNDGTLIQDTDGYALFNSDQALNFFQTVKAQNPSLKVVANLTQTDNGYIRQILDNPTAQATLADQAISQVKTAGIDGVNVDFEYTGANPEYRAKFTSFIQNLRARVQQAIPGGVVDVSVMDGSKNSLYDINALSQSADVVTVLAYNFAEAERRDNSLVSPKYGYSSFQYWNTVSDYMNQFLSQAPTSKLALETAWYGNGDNFPLPDMTVAKKTHVNMNTLRTPLDQATIDRLVSSVPPSAQAAARKNLPYMAKALEDEGILNSNVLAYMMATTEHETAGTFEPIEEIKGKKSARRLGYEGGADYEGRGFIQLTHLRNYLEYGRRIGMGDELAKHPELALRADVSAKILAAFFADNGVARLATEGDFISARAPVNPDYQASWIASLANKYLGAILG